MVRAGDKRIASEAGAHHPGLWSSVRHSLMVETLRLLRLIAVEGVKRRLGAGGGARLNARTWICLTWVRSRLARDGLAFVVMSTTSASQNLDYVTAVASRYIEQHLREDPLQWREIMDYLKAAGYTDEATAALTRAVLDLERTDVLCYAREGLRRPRTGDAAPAPLGEVAAAVLSLQWPCTRNNRPGGSRSIYEAFDELGGRYRHCDVYEAMHTLLKGHELKIAGQTYWQRTEIPSRFDAAGRFAQRAELVAALPPAPPARQQLEADLVAAYVTTLPHRYVREHPIGELKADVYEPAVRRIVEAKAAADVVTVAHAWAQAAAYRYAANTFALDDRTTVESIAILLPIAPTGTARSFLEHVAADCFEVELIYPHGDTFRHEQLT